MARTPKEITDAELAVMNLVWEHGQITSREIINVLYPGGRRSDYEVLQGLLNRLERKGFIKRDRTQTPHLFRPKIDREVLIDRSLQSIADKLCDGSFEPLLQQLINSEFTTDQVSALRDLIDESAANERAMILNT